MNRIVVGYDGSEAAGHAVDRAAEWARLYDCPLTVLTAAADRLQRDALEPPRAADEQLATEVAERGAARARAAGVGDISTRVSLEAPDDALVLCSRQGYDLVVVGHRGLGAIRELFLGSTAKAVVDRVETSVLVVR
jgi:nucleotide-binding universal stress UspA family protein